jgi:hypothetical protein
VEAEKNLHATIPPALLAQIENVARAEHISVDELVQGAVQRHIETIEWRKLLAFGEKHPKSLGLTEADVADAIAEVRGR